MKRNTEESNIAGQIPDKISDGFDKIVSPFEKFIEDEITGSVLLIGCMLLAVVLANSPWVNYYDTMIHLRIGVFAGEMRLEKTLQHWINDGLMALFFLVIGMEIKREMLAGELQNFSRSTPVIFAAAGGLVLPALFYFFLNYEHSGASGWGIPMATDAAFAVGILALLRGHIPSTLIAFLTALAIIDDIGAVLVIAVFYTETIQLNLLGLTCGLFGLLFLGNLAGVRHPLYYLLLGFCLWLAMLKSGVHASISGILVALTIPARPARETARLVRSVESLLSRLQRHVGRQKDENILADTHQHQLVEKVRLSAKIATTPLQGWTHLLQKPVTLLVMPLFALVNAGIAIDYETLSVLVSSRISWGIALGLILGKLIGITGGAWLALRTGLGTLPEGMRFHHLIGVGILGAVGFTMSIFIAGLGLADNPANLEIAKTAVLLTSVCAGLLGYVWLRWIPLNNNK